MVKRQIEEGKTPQNCKTYFFCSSSIFVSILFYVLSAINSAIVLTGMFQERVQFPTGGKVAELQGL